RTATTGTVSDEPVGGYHGEAPARVIGGDGGRELGQIESFVDPIEGRLHAPASEPPTARLGVGAHRVDCGHHTVSPQKAYPISDDTDVRQCPLLLHPRERRGLGLPVNAELPRGLDAGRHLGPDAVLERVERLPERGVVARSGPTVVQHRTPQLSTCARYPRYPSSSNLAAVATAASGTQGVIVLSAQLRIEHFSGSRLPLKWLAQLVQQARVRDGHARLVSKRSQSARGITDWPRKASDEARAYRISRVHATVGFAILGMTCKASATNLAPYLLVFVTPGVIESA